jgi:hypothetical protein
MEDMAGAVDDQSLPSRQWFELIDVMVSGIVFGGGRVDLAQNASHRTQTRTRQHGSLSITEYAPALPTPRV